jgi:hypothetical protein
MGGRVSAAPIEIRAHALAARLGFGAMEQIAGVQ